MYVRATTSMRPKHWQLAILALALSSFVLGCRQRTRTHHTIRPAEPNPVQLQIKLPKIPDLPEHLISRLSGVEISIYRIEGTCFGKTDKPIEIVTEWQDSPLTKSVSPNCDYRISMSLGTLPHSGDLLVPVLYSNSVGRDHTGTIVKSSDLKNKKAVEVKLTLNRTARGEELGLPFQTLGTGREYRYADVAAHTPQPVPVPAPVSVAPPPAGAPTVDTPAVPVPPVLVGSENAGERMPYVSPTEVIDGTNPIEDEEPLTDGDAESDDPELDDDPLPVPVPVPVRNPTTPAPVRPQSPSRNRTTLIALRASKAMVAKRRGHLRAHLIAQPVWWFHSTHGIEIMEDHGGRETKIPYHLVDLWFAQHMSDALHDLSLQMGVMRIRSLSVSRYSYVKGTGGISRHALGHAIDMSRFDFKTGDSIRVLDWSADSRKRIKLLEIRNFFCKRFHTVLGPRYNAGHANHFHIHLLREYRAKAAKSLPAWDSFELSESEPVTAAGAPPATAAMPSPHQGQGHDDEEGLSQERSGDAMAISPATSVGDDPFIPAGQVRFCK